jgi:hypothetical protein
MTDYHGTMQETRWILGHVIDHEIHHCGQNLCPGNRTPGSWKPTLQRLVRLLPGEREYLPQTGLRWRFVCYISHADRLAHPRHSWKGHRIFRVLEAKPAMYHTTRVRPAAGHVVR